MAKFEHREGQGLNFKEGLQKDPTLSDLSPDEFRRVIEKLNKKELDSKNE